MGVPERVPPAAKVPMTIEDLWKIPDDGNRYEIIEGELHVSPSPVFHHQTIVTTLAILLGRFLEDARLGSMVVAPMDVIFSDRDVCQPDVLFITKDRIPEIVSDRVRGAPDLAIEVLSPSTSSYDHVKKRLTYEKFGVKEYWIVDPETKTLSRYRLEGDLFGRPEMFETGAVVTTDLLPGFTLEIDRLFADRTGSAG